MNKIKFFHLVAFSLLLKIDAIAQTLNQGSVTNLQNDWNKKTKGCLDTSGSLKDFEKTGYPLCVSI